MRCTVAHRLHPLQEKHLDLFCQTHHHQRPLWVCFQQGASKNGGGLPLDPCNNLNSTFETNTHKHTMNQRQHMGGACCHGYPCGCRVKYEKPNRNRSLFRSSLSETHMAVSQKIITWGSGVSLSIQGNPFFILGLPYF